MGLEQDINAKRFPEWQKTMDADDAVMVLAIAVNKNGNPTMCIPPELRPDQVMNLLQICLERIAYCIETKTFPPKPGE